MKICKLTKQMCFRIGRVKRYRKAKRRLCNKDNSIVCPYSDGIPEHMRKEKVGEEKKE